ncbi:MAG: hypothetical protein LBI63_04165 [Candidatus Ancillula sp.]|jgi:ABC-type xylose transport system substrate-binding protein|nr:hypothetical protein [Candidatus Ancillula sp.]
MQTSGYQTHLVSSRANLVNGSVFGVLRSTIAFLTAVVLVFTLTACSQKGDFAYEDAVPTNWKVGISIPTSSLAIIDESTVGRWANIGDWIRNELVRHGFSAENVVIRSSSSRKDQIKDLKKFAEVEKVDELVVAPINYTKSELKTLNQLNADPSSAFLANMNHISQSAESNSKEFPIDQESEKSDEHAESIVDILKNAKASGIFTVGIGSNDLGGFPFDYFATTISPEDVANVQAGFIIDQLKLPQVDQYGNLKDIPKDSVTYNVEVLISDAAYSSTKRYFKQLWERIGPYFKKGYFKSRSGVLTQDTKSDEASEQEVIEKLGIPDDGDKPAGVMHDVLDKYYKNNEDQLDVVFGQFDGLSRGAVRACVENKFDSGSRKWPLIVGAEAERLSISDVVEGKQAMTIAYDSRSLMQALGQVLANEALRQPQPVKGQPITTSEELQKEFDEKTGTLYLESMKNSDGVTISLIVTRPVTIVQDNLKDFLIDKGYITDAYAGI